MRPELTLQGAPDPRFVTKKGTFGFRAQVINSDMAVPPLNYPRPRPIYPQPQAPSVMRLDRPVASSSITLTDQDSRLQRPGTQVARLLPLSKHQLALQHRTTPAFQGPDLNHDWQAVGDSQYIQDSESNAINHHAPTRTIPARASRPSHSTEINEANQQGNVIFIYGYYLAKSNFLIGSLFDDEEFGDGDDEDYIEEDGDKEENTSADEESSGHTTEVEPISNILQPNGMSPPRSRPA